MSGNPAAAFASALLLALADPGHAQVEPGGESKPIDADLQRIEAAIQRSDEQRGAGDLDASRETVRDALVECLALPDLAERTGAADVLGSLGASAYRARDLRTAHDAWQWTKDQRERTLPDDDDSLQTVRLNLANAKKALGDLPGALALAEKAVAVYTARLPDDHATLQSARGTLAHVQKAVGDLHSARALELKVLSICERTLPADHEKLQIARSNLAVTLNSLGDAAGSRALDEKVLAVRERTLPDDHFSLQITRSNLALTKHDLGDFAGALPLQEKVVAVFARTLPEEHPYLLDACNNLAITKASLGDLTGAAALQERVLAARKRTLPDGHVYVEHARSNLAASRFRLGEVADARDMFEAVLAGYRKSLPADHPLVLAAQNNLAEIKLALGDVPGALALQERILESRTRALPHDHPSLQVTRRNVAWTRACSGQGDRAIDLARERATIARQRLGDWILSPRETGVMAAQEADAWDLLMTFAQGFGDLAAQPELAADALLASQMLRGIETRVARTIRSARQSDTTKVAELQTALRAAVRSVSQIAQSTPPAGEEREAALRTRDARLARAVADKERVQRQLAALAERAYDPAAVTPEQLAAKLPERSAAVAIVNYRNARPDRDAAQGWSDEPTLAALVLHRDAKVTFRGLGPSAPVEELVEKLRTEVGAGRDRGLRSKDSTDPHAVRKQLRARVLDPVLEACGDIDTIYLSVDEALQLVPLDALPDATGEPVGSRVTLRSLVSLFDLLDESATDIGEQPSLLAFGDIDYDEAPTKTAPSVGGAAGPVVEGTRAGTPKSFRLLRFAEDETDLVQRYHQKAFKDAKRTVRTGSAASKARLVDAAPEATFLHIATHGYFAPESVRSTADRSDPTSLQQRRITGLSPMVLTGLALAGANMPPDDLGRHTGIITAEELLSLDLSSCYLVTLSACDTSLGVRRAGQGYASLRAALLGAGARYALTSLWKVGDEATMELMVDFYRRLWIQKKDPHVALWEAKLASRKKGVPFRDWAGWVLTGR